MAKRKRQPKGRILNDRRLFTLDVFVIGGPITEEFSKAHTVEPIR